MWAWLFYALKSAQFLKSFGLAPDDIKNILIIFAVLFFGLVFFAGFYVFVLNIYRLVTVKGSKIRYVFGLLLGIVVIGAAITLGTISVMRIRSLVGENKVVTDDIILPHLQVRDGMIWIKDGVPLVAPLNMRFQLSKDNYTKHIAASLGQVQIAGFTLDCGNGQIVKGNNTLHLGVQNGFFPDGCLYTKKGVYTLSLAISYYDGKSGEPLDQVYSAWTIEIPAEIALTPMDDELRLNDKKNELIVGTAPVTVDYRAQLLFSDLKLDNNVIQRDLDGDKKVDTKNNSAFQFQYTTPKFYDIYYKLPDLPQFGDIWFEFGVRVIESELPACRLDIVPSPTKERAYTITSRFDESVSVQKYVYTVHDIDNDSYLKPIQTDKSTWEYVFPQGGAYEITAAYFTANDKKGSCGVVPVQVGYNENRVDFDVYWRQGDGSQFLPVGSGRGVRFEEDMISSNLVPVTLQFRIKGTYPDKDAILKLFYNDTQIFPDTASTYELSLGKVGTWLLSFHVLPSEKSLAQNATKKEAVQNYTVVTTRKSVVATMKVNPVVWEDPLEVSLDASLSPLYDEKDEIVYFTWDFGDGTKQENVSQWKITHVYRFDTEKNNGTYYPSVTVKTKLWEQDSYRVPTPVAVKRKQQEAVIYLDSHPTQQAKVNDLVKMTLSSDGVIKWVVWDFGNNKGTSCTDRSCINTATRFEQPGDYTIKATVEYENSTPSAAQVRIRVFE